MALNLGSPFLSPFSHSSTPHLSKLPESFPSTTSLISLLLGSNYVTSALKTLTSSSSSSSSSSKLVRTKASLSESENEVAGNSGSDILDEELLSRISAAKDANGALEIIAENSKRNGGVVSVSDCRLIINAALDRNNAELALSVFYAMRSSFDQGVIESGPFVERWKWSRPDVSVYASSIQGLAATLRVSDALRMIDDICRVGVSPGEEVPFGKVVRCPSCLIGVAVAQPQNGIQIVSCAKCRYKYELVSGDIVSINSEEIRNCS